MATWLKTLLQQKHLQNHDLFTAQYDSAAASLGLPLAAPSRAQFHRWLNGELTGLPHPRHCQVLEALFPQWTAAELFAEATNDLAPFKAGTPAAPADDSTVRRTKAHLAGTIVDLHTRISIDIDAQNHACVRYAYKLLNLTEEPVLRIPRGIWFRHTHAPLTIEPIQFEPHQVYIERLHDAGEKHTKIAYHLSPPIPPNGTGQYGCEVRGGMFLDELYWRHSVTKHTEQVTISVVHRSQRLKHFAAIEELVNGTEALITDQLHWSQTDEGISLELECRDLQPTQAVTVRWEVLDPCN